METEAPAPVSNREEAVTGPEHVGAPRSNIEPTSLKSNAESALSQENVASEGVDCMSSTAPDADSVQSSEQKKGELDLKSANRQTGSASVDIKASEHEKDASAENDKDADAEQTR